MGELKPYITNSRPNPPLPISHRATLINILEVMEKKKEKKIKTKNTMPIKRTQQLDTNIKDADLTQDNNSKAKTSKKKKKGSRRKINANDFPLERSATTYDLIMGVSWKGPSIT